METKDSVDLRKARGRKPRFKIGDVVNIVRQGFLYADWKIVGVVILPENGCVSYHIETANEPGAILHIRESRLAKK